MDCVEFVNRRQEFMELMGRESIALIPTAPEHIRNRDVHFPYRADSDFYYLTGFPEPEALAVLIPEREQGQYILFCRERDAEKETWHGRRAGLEGACDLYGADHAFPIADIDDIVPGLLENRHRVYYPTGRYPEFDKQVMIWINQLREKSRMGINAPTEMVSFDQVLHDLRLYKSDAEVETIRKAVAITVAAHKRAMQVCRSGMFEYEIEAEIIHEFMQHGSRFPAYPSIVGSGVNGCILHYTENNAQLQDGDLVLIDAGAEFDYYAADITRTFPVNGQFSPAQRTLYELVLKTQRAALAEVQPGHYWNDPHKAAVETMTKGLLELGLLVGKLDLLLEEEAYKRFYMHRTGHWLGMDVHDVGGYKIGDKWRLLEAGMVMTIEPGLYIPASEDVPEEFWNIGIRIEDDVLVTEDGHEVLTAAAPKTVAEIEALMANHR